MVMDYGDISALVKPLISQLDHSYMVDPSDGEIRDLLKSLGLKIVEAPFHSTAENIAQWILDQILPTLVEGSPAGLRLCEVTARVHETRTTMAEAKWIKS
jgi:6-pyruvoyltetrahydropterin/6-carboxytetrahydropterin synthase